MLAFITIVPQTVSAWITLFFGLVTFGVFIIYMTREMWNSDSFKMKFISKSKINVVEAQVIEKTKYRENVIENEGLSFGFTTRSMPKVISSRKRVLDLLFVKFKMEDSIILLKVSKEVFEELKEKDRGVLQYYRSYFYSFVKDEVDKNTEVSFDFDF